MSTITGSVFLRGTTKGVPDASVVLVRGKTTADKTVTDAKGSFEFKNVKEASGYIVRVTGAGISSVSSDPFDLRADSTLIIEADASSVTTQTTATTTTSTTTSTDTRTIMGTTLTSVTTDTSTTTATTATTATSATTATVPPGTSSGPPAGSTSFDDLLLLVSTTKFDTNPAVSIDEARQFRRLYTIGNYSLARVTGAIAALNALLNTSSPPGSNGQTSTLPLVSKQQLIDKHQATIDSILARASDNTRTEGDLQLAIRSQFDLGTGAVPNVNVAFKSLFRDFVGLCSNDLLAVDPQAVAVTDLTEQQKKEELNNFLKRTKRALLRLVENMSIAGTLGSASLVDKWSRVFKDSIDVLGDVGQFVGDDDNDRRHVWSIVAELNRIPKAQNDAYVVHAREGGLLLNDAIDAYQQLSTKGALTDEGTSHLRDFFFDSAKYGINGETISARLRRNALLIQENWIAAWG